MDSDGVDPDTDSDPTFKQETGSGSDRQEEEKTGPDPPKPWFIVYMNNEHTSFNLHIPT